MDKNGLEQQIAVLLEQLIQAEQLSALGELTGTVTHEFNNILTTIINYAKMGLRHKDDATREKAFEKILNAGQRAAKITSNVLGMARNRGEKYEPTDLAALIEDTLVLLERELQKYRVAVEKDLGQVPLAMVSGNQIQQVLVNLLINARQAMPNGGKVLIALRHDAKSKMVDIIVRDTGTGIPEDKLPRIFEPFYTTKTGPDASGKGGTGLGLATCRRIIETHQGRIRVESSLGRGTAFILKLPEAPVSTRSLPTEPPAAPIRSAG